MRETHLTIPELALIALTRGAAGAGLALLLADRLSGEQRKALGWGLFLIGALSTIPLVADVLGKSQSMERTRGRSERPLIGV
jgi:hypothetical protein